MAAALGLRRDAPRRREVALAGLLEVQAGKRLFLAIIAAGVFSLLACAAFYLIEAERLTARQLAALGHHLGQAIATTDLGWRQAAARQAIDGNLGVVPTADLAADLGWHFEADRVYRRVPATLANGRRLNLHYPIDGAWLAAHGQPELRLFLVRDGAVAASSLGEAGAGEAAALDPTALGRVVRGGQLFVQAPMRWDGLPDSPLLVAQQRLSLPFSLAEIAAAGLFLWAALGGLIWLTVGVWLDKALHQVEFLAYHDPLTGLINREALRIGLPHLLAENRRNGTLLAVFFLDLDHFKTINDSLGHAVGDQVLAEVARRLQGAVRESDFVARLGGDEFVVVLGDLKDAADAAPLARKLIERLADPIPINGHRLQTGTSVGIATYPGSAEDPETLVKQADSALYAAKQQGRGRCHYYDESLGAEADRRFTLELQLRQALAEGGLAVHYQPVVDGAYGRLLTGFEALVRWPREGAPVAPADFIPIAEESGLIVPLGDWVLATACRQLKAWQDRHPGAARLSVSVNVSVRQLHAGGFADRVAAALADSGLPARCLILELTESLYVDPHTAIPETLCRLRGMGVRLAMDDFGTGYSALSSLTRLPLDRLKIDRAFVAKLGNAPEDLVVARTIIAIGRQLGLEVVAEGVETPDQAAILAACGCHVLQGWLFGRPAGAEEIEAML